MKHKINFASQHTAWHMMSQDNYRVQKYLSDREEDAKLQPTVAAEKKKMPLWQLLTLTAAFLAAMGGALVCLLRMNVIKFH